ncbi:MAG TPA: VOC family protein [Rhodanobacteraceae bacterium]|nr:VOC family protein [Rhodanobacteraceae bacterium]
MSAVVGIAHVNFRGAAPMIERLRAFYRDVIGLDEGPRPPFRSQGHWLYANGEDVVHLTVDAARAAAPFAGALDHIALAIDDLAAALARLDAAGVAYELDAVPGGAAQVFFRDPAGVGVELNFAASQNRPA